VKEATHIIADGSFETAIELEVRDDPTKQRHRSYFMAGREAYTWPI
jgi:uncharacterized protein